MIDFKEITTALADLDEDRLKTLLNEVMAGGGGDAQQALEACQSGMTEVGNRFDKGEYFISDLIFSGEMLEAGMAIIGPALGRASGEKLGKLILATVHGDLHDIGKNIVRTMLEIAGFEVVDMGIDTPVEKIVNTAKEQGIRIIALSGVLTLALNSMKDTVDGFKTAGMRDGVKIIVGGSPITQVACTMIGADDWAYNPQKGVDICKKWALDQK